MRFAHFLLIAGLVVIVFPVLAQDKDESLFREYPALEEFKGKNAPLALTDKDKQFQSRLRAAAADEPNFAGHNIVTSWGCGTQCLMGAVIDANSGKVHPIPHSTCCWEESDRPIDIRRYSRLVVFSGLLNEEGSYGSHYYEFTNGRFKHINSEIREFSCKSAAGEPAGMNHSLTIRVAKDGKPRRVDYSGKGNVSERRSGCTFSNSQKDKSITWKDSGRRVEIVAFENTSSLEYSADSFTLTFPEPSRGFYCFQPAKTPKTIILRRGNTACEVVE